MKKLLIASLKQYYRDKQAVFWSLIFPVIFLLVFSLFDFTGSINANIIVIDDAKNPASEQLLTVLKDVNGVSVNSDFNNIEEARDNLQDSVRLDFIFTDNGEEETERSAANIVLAIPSNYGELGGEPASIEMLFDQASEGVASPSGIVASIIEDVSLGIAGLQSPVEIEREGISVNEISYFDILVPGIIGMSIMQSGIIGISASIATFKEKQILKRLSATPLPTWKFLFAEVLTHILGTFIQVTLLLLLALFIFDANIYGSIPLIYFLSFIGTFAFLNMGFIAAALTSSSNAAQGVASAISTPMMFLSGVFFERETLPAGVRQVADLLPLSPMLDALRDISLRNSSILDVSLEIGIIAIWTLVTFIIAARVFKFREE